MLKNAFIVLCLALSVQGLRRVPNALYPIQPEEDDSKIVGGSAATIEQFPYQISLQTGLGHICGGSIYDSNSIVTAAHCTNGKSASQLHIRAGSTNRNSGGQYVDVSRIHQDPKFSSSTIDYDVSVLDLSKSLSFGSGVDSIGLSSSEPTSGKCTVTGWGTLSAGGSSPDNLRQVDVPIVGRVTCNSNYGGDITSRMICAGEAGKDSCQGDSGGPLKCSGRLAGIVSWGIGCADAGHPGVYTNVANSEIHSYITGNARSNDHLA